MIASEWISEPLAESARVTFYGVPAHELSRDELLAALVVAMRAAEREKDAHNRTLLMFVATAPRPPHA